MLTYLNIKNFALIENCEIEFSEGLNIISGETGSGKSILIQALSILLGQRASVEQIRSGRDEAVLNATLLLNGKNILKEKLNEFGIGVNDDEIIIRRILTSSGKSRSFINGNQVTSKELELISSYLFDFHGQHDGVSLLKKQTHIEYLDNFSDVKEELKKLKLFYSEIKKTEEAIKFIENSDKDKEKKIELLTYEISEIEEASIKDNEDAELKKQITLYENSEKILTALNAIGSDLNGENGVLYKLRNVKNLFNQIGDSDERYSQKAEETNDIFYKLEDIEREITSEIESFNFQPEKLDKLIERAELIERLKRKYGDGIDIIKEYYEKAKKELELINFTGEKKDKLVSDLKDLRDKYIENAIIASKKRREGAVILSNKVKEELKNLGMEKVDFKIKIEVEETGDNYITYNNKKLRFRENGVDDVEFLISPNLGEPLKPLLKIASGGELSRIILSLKTVLSENDSVETMIFDEIDVGIGGKVALSVASTLKRLSSKKQILCITHLPQIAASGTKNFRISKNSSDDRTFTEIKRIDDDEKVKEIARMLSGHITETSLSHAKELIENLNPR
ncbi:MAG TPA: DNA repair protein RecN [Spirochaetota bacterium]|nr:DNA repair protein RecN [Spirochaetota bacterium]